MKKLNKQEEESVARGKSEKYEAFKEIVYICL